MWYENFYILAQFRIKQHFSEWLHWYLNVEVFTSLRIKKNTTGTLATAEPTCILWIQYTSSTWTFICVIVAKRWCQILRIKQLRPGIQSRHVS